MAERYFGDANPVGKTLTSKEIGTFTITGVFKPIRKFRTHLNADIVVSMATLPLVQTDMKADDWLSYNTYTFALLTKRFFPRRPRPGAGARVRRESEGCPFQRISKRIHSAARHCRRFHRIGKGCWTIHPWSRSGKWASAYSSRL